VWLNFCVACVSVVGLSRHLFVLPCCRVLRNGVVVFVKYRSWCCGTVVTMGLVCCWCSFF